MIQTEQELRALIDGLTPTPGLLPLPYVQAVSRMTVGEARAFIPDHQVLSAVAANAKVRNVLAFIVTNMSSKVSTWI